MIPYESLPDLVSKSLLGKSLNMSTVCKLGLDANSTSLLYDGNFAFGASIIDLRALGSHF